MNWSRIPEMNWSRILDIELKFRRLTKTRFAKFSLQKKLKSALGIKGYERREYRECREGNIST